MTLQGKVLKFGENIELESEEGEDESREEKVVESKEAEVLGGKRSKKHRYERDLSQRQEEKREYSDVAWSVYLEYFRAAGSNFLLFIIVFLFLLVQAINNFGDWWLREW